MLFDEEEQKKAQAEVATRCQGERCNFAGCGQPCVEKVETDMAGRYGHPLTAYVCREHYDAIMHGGKGVLSPEAQLLQRLVSAWDTPSDGWVDDVGAVVEDARRIVEHKE